MAVLQDNDPTRRLFLPARCVVGRSRACDLELADEHVSGQHAAIEWNGTAWSVRDLGSSNGTFVGGRRLGPGEQVELRVGQELRFGRTPRPWTLIDASPPALMAVCLADATARLAEGGYLALPDEQRPEVACYADAQGGWVVEVDGTPRPLHDREVLQAADGSLWCVHVPTTADGTLKDGDAPQLLPQLRLRIAFTRDEEHVEVTARAGGRVLDLKARAHHYLLLVLARQRIADRSAGVTSGEQGWIRQDALLRMLRIDDNHLNITIHRARTQLGQLGVVDAAGLVERRSGARLLRIGVEQLELAPLDAADTH